MIRTLRRVFWKIYHFFAFLSCFLFILSPIVNADTLDSCYSDYLHSYNTSGYGKPYIYNPNSQSWIEFGSSGHQSWKTLEVLIPIYSGSSSYILFPTGASSDSIWPSCVAFYDSNMIRQYDNCNYSSTFFTFTYDHSTRQLVITVGSDYSSYSYLSTTWSDMLNFAQPHARPLPWGSQSSGDVAIADFDLTTCPIPPTPPAPEPDSTYSSFLTIFLDRISYLTTGFTTNPYLFAFVGVIFAWVILEIALKLYHLRGGYKK